MAALVLEGGMMGSGVSGSKSKDEVSSIGRSLVGLVLVAVVPLLIFGGGVAWMIVDQKKSAVADELASTARALRVAVDRELFSQFQAMEVLAADDSLDSANPANFRDRAERTIKARGEWWNVGLIDPQSYSIVASAIPAPSPAPITLSPEKVDEVVRTRKPVIVGVFASGQITKKPIVLFMSPVIRANQVRNVLAVTMNPQPLSEIFAEQRLPASWTGAIVDTNMTLAGRSRAPERYVGVRATPTLADRIAASESGMFTALNQEGASVYTVFSRSPLTGWSVAIGVPAAEVEGPIQRMLLQLAVAGCTLIVFVLILTAKVGRGIVQRRNAYEQAIKESESRFRLMANFAPVFIWISDKNNAMTWFNQTMLVFRGRTLEQELGKGWCEGVHPDDSKEYFEKFASHTQRREPFTTEFRLKRYDGKYRWIFETGTPRFDEEGNFMGYIGSAFDINERVESEVKLRSLSTAIEQSPISVVITNGDANIEYVNPRFEEVTGYISQEAIGHNPRILQSGLTPERTYLELWDTVTQGRVWHGELVNKRKNGEIYWEDAHIAPVMDDTGKVTHYVAAKIDITQRKRNEEAIRQSEARLQFMLENSPIAVRITSIATHKVLFANPCYVDLIGTLPDQEISVNPRQYYVNPQDYDEALELLGRGERVTNKLVELNVPSAHSKTKWALASYLQLEYQNEPVVLGWFYDISDRKMMEEKIQHLAHFDSLTDLPNRALFADRLQQALVSAKRDKTHSALLFIDLDRFKPINDTLGHNVGDQLLKDAAHRIQDCLRESDTVARIGGDEFVVLLPTIEAVQDALSVAEKIHDSLNQPFDSSAQSLRISCSTGIAIYPEHGNDGNALIKNADIAMYYAKDAGRNNVKIYQSNMQGTNA